MHIYSNFLQVDKRLSKPYFHMEDSEVAFAVHWKHFSHWIVFESLLSMKQWMLIRSRGIVLPNLIDLFVKYLRYQILRAKLDFLAYALYCTTSMHLGSFVNYVTRDAAFFRPKCSLSPPDPLPPFLFVALHSFFFRLGRITLHFALSGTASRALARKFSRMYPCHVRRNFYEWPLNY